MYVAALVPALLIILCYCMLILGISLLRPKWVPALPLEARSLKGSLWSLLVLFIFAGFLYFVLERNAFVDKSPEVRIVWSATVTTVASLLLCLANRRFKLGLISPASEQVVFVLVPPLALMFLVLGTVFLGIATPTEGGAMGAVGALLLALAKGRLSQRVLKQALDATTKLTAFVMMILIGARVFGLTFFGIEGDRWIEELFLQLPGGQIGFLIFVTLIILVLSCFLDFFEIAFIVVPLLVPVAVAMEIDLIWFGIIISINLMTSFLTPPFGFSLFYLRSVVPESRWHDHVSGRELPGVSTMEIYKGVVPFIIIQVAMIFLVIAFPELVVQDQPLPVADNVDDLLWLGE